MLGSVTHVKAGPVEVDLDAVKTAADYGTTQARVRENVEEASLAVPADVDAATGAAFQLWELAPPSAVVEPNTPPSAQMAQAFIHVQNALRLVLKGAGQEVDGYTSLAQMTRMAHGLDIINTDTALALRGIETLINLAGDEASQADAWEFLRLADGTAYALEAAAQKNAGLEYRSIRVKAASDDSENDG
jgi:hypothetical protein